MTIVIDLPVSSSTRPTSRSRGWSYDRTEPEGTELGSVVLTSNEDFLNRVLEKPKRVHYQSRDKLYVVENARFKAPQASLGIQAIHQAFAEHVPLSLRPDTVWYMIVSECAEHVRQNADRYARLFTDTPGEKQLIEVRDDTLRYDAPSDWMRAINLFREPLAKRISDEALELFVPSFSTSTIEDETSLLVALMDVASPYYEYQMSTRCGIPQIRLEGEAAEWQSLYARTEVLARQFDGLSDYFSDLLPVLEKIVRTATGEAHDTHFWTSIYKYENGSGGPYVTGWITAFFAYELDYNGDSTLKRKHEWQNWGSKTNSFPTHYRKVPFVWAYFGRKIDMAFAAGIAGVDYEDGFLAPRLGFSVVEV